MATRSGRKPRAGARKEEPAQDFEKLGVFYLGRPYDLGTKTPRDGLLLYDAKDLVTHAVCVGMTGSGKTGLCLSLLEEALLDGIPALIIDPKGDLPNLLLTFPDLRPEDFAPWVNPEDAQRKGMTVEAYARQQADFWRRGLAEWGQSGDRIRRLRQAADFAVYTPGSQAGLTVSILRSFAAPPPALREDGEQLRERIGTAATGLLGLLGLEADPLRSREHVLIAKLLEAAWVAGRDLDLAGLIQQIQEPPISRIGALELEAFYPARDRFALATQLNNILAAPGFDLWLQGDPLDIDAMLHAPDARPRAAIFSIAHLGDAERMFFVSLLLNETLAWMRAQPGTTSLRALVYMDEIFGYLPPVANPPSKLPMLTLLKQARAFGVGLVVCTQNPVDLDYKALSNAGTWFIGRLQTERDKARLLEGLEGAGGGTGRGFDRSRMEEVLAGLGNRIFLMNNVHEDAPEVFQTRWSMSYLRGPLTRAQIKMLMDPRRPAMAVPAAAPPETAVAPSMALAAAGARVEPAPAKLGTRPILAPGVPQYFLPAGSEATPGGTRLYRPMLLGAATIRFSDAKVDVDVTQEVALLAPIGDGPIPVSWDAAAEAAIAPDELETSPREPAQFAELPAAAGKAKNYEAWKREFAAWLAGRQRLELLRDPRSKVISRPGEAERSFRIRVGQAARTKRDRWAEELRAKYAPRVAALEERLRRARQAVAREQEQVTQSGIQTAISVGASLLGAFLGRKVASAGNIGRATTAARGMGRVLKERQDVARAAENVAALEKQLADLETQFRAELASLEAGTGGPADPLETLALRPKKADITIRVCALVWAPYWRDAAGGTAPAWR
jgi:hypothetical protein